FSSHTSSPHSALHSFPTRRSSDLDLNRKAGEGQDELFPLWRHHAIFTDSPFVTLQAEEHHRDHAVVEQVFADWASGPLAHLPSGDRKSTRLNSSHLVISYAVFCLK